MSEQDFPPVPPVVPPAAPTPTPAPPEAGPGAQPPLPRRSRAWMWWTVGMIVALAVLVGSCTIPFAMLGKSGTGSLSSGGFGDAVAVIRVDGVIAGSGSAIDGYITPESFLDDFNSAIDDDSVKAILLRVDSPGGTVAASEEIAAYVKDCDKPVVVSIGDVGASGAYMVSSQSDEIWAMPGSAVGSIGVITEIPNVEGLLNKVGVEFTVITAGKYKDAGSPYRPLTKEEEALIQGEVDEAYTQFIDIVADGRDMPRSKVESLATGWAWSGETAKGLGLVDELGTYQDAMDRAADLGGIDGDYDIVTYDEQFQDIFGSLLGIRSALDKLTAIAEQGSGTAARPVVPK